jgi:dUTP pyrophosphatase
MSKLIVKVQKIHENAVVPEYAREGDAGFDLVAVDKLFLGSSIGAVVVYDTGLAFEIPEGHVGLVFPRSSIYNYSLQLCNSVAVIDSGYRGSVLCKFRVTKKFGKTYKVGDRIAQMMILPYPQVKLIEQKNLSETERGEGAFGSTGQ